MPLGIRGFVNRSQEEFVDIGGSKKRLILTREHERVSDKEAVITGDVDDSPPDQEFERLNFLDRPFITQTPGYREEGDGLNRHPSSFGLRLRARHAAAPQHSVDEIVGLLRSGARNPHFETGGRPGVAKRDNQNSGGAIAGAPLQNSD